MKIKNLVLMFSLAAVFAACQNENEPKDTASKPGTTGDCRIIIEGDETLSQSSRSSGTIQFEGGSASGAGLYDGTARAIVSATPDPGYEIKYFYGGPESEPRKYDNANGGATSFDVPIGGLDHLFHVGFQEKKGTLTVIAEEGGTVSPTGTTEVQRDVEFPISAIPNSGYEFAGWKINSGEITIANQNSANTTATLIGINSTITASFKKNTPKVYFSIKTVPATNDPSWRNYIVITAQATEYLPKDLNIMVSFTCTSYTEGGSAVNSGLSDELANGVIEAGKSSGEIKIAGCGLNPENLKITSIEIRQPSGWEAVIF